MAKTTLGKTSLCNRLLEKFDFENDFPKGLAPANVIKCNMKSISELFYFVANVVGLDHIQDFDDEWRELLHCNFNEYNLFEENLLNHFWRSY